MPNDISTEITNLQNDRTAIRSALAAKGVTATDHNFVDFATDIAAIPSGGATEAEEKDINFYDYDGFRCASWTLAELANKTALPDAPDHSADEVPLTSKGWNWTLADLKTLNRRMNVGQEYGTADGKTHLICEFVEGRLSPVVGLAVNGTVTIDWGDNTTDTVTGTSATVNIDTAHTYSAAGWYDISIAPASGTTYAILGTSTYSNILKKNGGTTTNENLTYANALKRVYLGSNLRVAKYGFNNCYSLKAISSYVGIIDEGSFMNCRSLNTLIVPHGSLTLYNSCIYGCYTLQRCCLPKSVTSINNSVFANCQGISEINLSDAVTSLGVSVFSNNNCLSNIVLPATLTSINQSAFNNCTLLGFIKFLGSTPPTVANANAWTNLPTDCKILVPYSADHSVLQSYKTAANYPDPTVYTYEEY